MNPVFRNIPNFLSASRLLAFPFLLGLVFAENKPAFVLLLSVCLVTDILDGLIARLFKWQTEFGAKLDSAADLAMYVAAFIGMVKLEPDFIAEKKWELIFLLVLWTMTYLISLIRFQKLPHLHLYSTKVAGYFQGIFVFTFFNWGNADWYFYLVWWVSMLAFAEELIVISRIPELRSNVKGIFWMWKEKGKIA